MRVLIAEDLSLVLFFRRRPTIAGGGLLTE